MNNLWGLIDLKKWKSTPCINGVIATEKDIQNGKAVFQIGSADNVEPYDLDLPKCGILYEEDNNHETQTPIIIIQAENADGTIYIGYRNIEGGNGVCSGSEVELLDEPNNLFYENQKQV
jgi:hypothetical protein